MGDLGRGQLQKRSPKGFRKDTVIHTGLAIMVKLRGLALAKVWIQALERDFRRPSLERSE